MGKMLDSLMKLNGKHGHAAEPVPKECPPADASEPVAVEPEAAEELPFIEVGAPGKKVEGSPMVLAAAPSKEPAAPKVPNPKITLAQSTLVPALAQPQPAGVTFEAYPCAPAARKPCRDIITFHQPDHPIARQYVDLFHQMLEDTAGESRALAFAGAAPQTGTTTVVLNLACAGAGAKQHRIVVVEGNLLRPALAQRLALDRAAGLLDVLAGAVALEKTVVPTLLPQLHVMLAGNHKALARHMTPEALRWILGWLRERFDVILIDGPDLSEADETATLAAPADGLYLVVPSEEEHGTIGSLTRNLTRRGARVRGFIHTHFENM